MRYSVIATGMLLSTVVFASCTCHKDVAPPPTFPERSTGFSVSGAKPSPKVAQAATPTPAAAAPQMAQGPTSTPVQLPSDFPPDVPVFKDASVTQVQSLANNAHNVIFQTTAPVADVAKFYRDKMREGGWKATQEFQREQHAFASFSKAT